VSDPFSFRTSKDGQVFISRGGKQVTTLRGESAQRFLARARTVDGNGAQQLMARATGHYKHGNER
jgi:hypothetical protein